MDGLVRPATWLEMAGAPQWRPNPPKVRVHPVVGPEGACYALTMDCRWLCSTNGNVTLFHSLGAVVRFLQVSNVHDFEAGEPCDMNLQADGFECLGMNKGRGLRACTERGPGCPSGKADAAGKGH